MQAEFKCEECSKVLSSSSSLSAHKLTHSSDKPWLCEICNKGFNQKAKLKEHINRHLDVRPFVCKTCGKGFFQKDRLKTHEMIHSSDRPFECYICEKSFRRKYELTRHSKLHDTEERQKLLKYECDICGKKSYSPADNKKHMLKHTSDKQWTCSICSRLFKDKYNLRNHLLLVHREGINDALLSTYSEELFIN